MRKSSDQEKDEHPDRGQCVDVVVVHVEPDNEDPEDRAGNEDHDPVDQLGREARPPAGEPVRPGLRRLRRAADLLVPAAGRHRFRV